MQFSKIETNAISTYLFQWRHETVYFSSIHYSHTLTIYYNCSVYGFSVAANLLYYSNIRLFPLALASVFHCKLCWVINLLTSLIYAAFHRLQTDVILTMNFACNEHLWYLLFFCHSHIMSTKSLLKRRRNVELINNQWLGMWPCGWKKTRTHRWVWIIHIIQSRMFLGTWWMFKCVIYEC